MLVTLQAKNFYSYKNCQCRLTLAGGIETELELVEITENSKAAISLEGLDVRIPFSLIFKTPLEYAFDANHCHLHHPTLGILKNLLITRILPPDPRDKTAWYQIIFA